MSIFRRSVIIISAILILFGSGGWVLTDHFCREEVSSCAEPQKDEPCCCTNDQSLSLPEEYPQKTYGVATSCCIDQSIYFSMPVFRLDANNFHTSDFHLVDLFSYYSPDVTPAISENNCSLHKPPPLIKGGTPLLFETGSLRI